MQNTDQQADDRGSTIFSPDGRLYQVKYAREAVKQGSPSVGVRATDGVVLAAEHTPRSSLMEPDSIEKLHAVDDRVGIASAGHAADARRLVDFARRRAQTERLRYGEPIDVETLTKAVTDQVQEHTQTGGARPFGTALLVGGVAGGSPRLFETDPSGTPSEWRAAAVGRDEGPIREYLEGAYEDGIDLSAAIELAIRALAAEGTDRDAFDPAHLGLSTIDGEGYRAYAPAERREVLDGLDLLDETAS